MANSKHHKDHKQKLNQFKQQTMSNQKQSAIPKTHLVPHSEWQSTDKLEITGDQLERIDKALVAAYQAIQLAGKAYSEAVNMNITGGKAKIAYTWNNGEPATVEEVENYKAQIARIDELRKQQIAEAQQAKEAGLPDGERLPGATLLDATADSDPEQNTSSETKTSE